MKKTIKMSKEDAVKFFNSSNDQGFKDLLESEFGKDFAKPKEITDKVNDINSLEEHFDNFNLPYDLETKDKLEKSINAVYILSKVAECYNQGTKLDWKNTSIYKYLPYKYFHAGGGFGCWSNDLIAPSCLFYKSVKLSEASYKNFKKYWEDYWIE